MNRRAVAGLSGMTFRHRGAPMFQHAAARDLRACFRGPVHEPGDDAYDDQRAIFGGALIARPAVVAEALTPADVQNAVLVAREHGLPFAVQSTGHGTRVSCDDGLLLKTGRLGGVLVDPGRRTVRVGAGATWGEVIAAAAPFGLAPVSGSHASVGVAGFTLGGGIGPLSRRYGYGADNLLHAEVVTADGDLVQASTEHNPGLFWALRGGGANFGAVTSMEIRLHPVARVFAGQAFFPIEHAAHALARFRDLALALPRELGVSYALLRSAVDRGIAGPVLAVRACWSGDPDDGVRAVLPLWRAAGTPLADELRSMPYADAGAAMGATSPIGYELFADLPDPLIAVAVDSVRRPLGANALEIRLLGGAPADPGPGAGPSGQRDVPFSMAIDGTADAVASLRPYATGGAFLNSLADQSRTAAAYAPGDWERLRALKRVWDSDGVFGMTHPIPPAAAAVPTAA
jgi:FAD/FMN-containing dehydrogenase